MTTTASAAFDAGDAILQSFIRGDALIGLIADVLAREEQMLEALWTAAAEQHLPAVRALADCYGATFGPIGAFDGVGLSEPKRPWPDSVLHVRDDDRQLERALRALHWVADLGASDGALAFARLARQGSLDVQRAALPLLERFDDVDGALTYQRGLVLHWLQRFDEAAACHRQAAARGNGDAMFELHLFHAQGIGMPVDAAASREWLLRAVEAEHPRALYNVGAFHATGNNGFDVDIDKTVSFYKRAARRGHARAAATLGVMILSGELDGSTDEAGRWLTQAEEGGYDVLQMLDVCGLDDPRA